MLPTSVCTYVTYLIRVDSHMSRMIQLYSHLLPTSIFKYDTYAIQVYSNMSPMIQVYSHMLPTSTFTTYVNLCTGRYTHNTTTQI